MSSDPEQTMTEAERHQWQIVKRENGRAADRAGPPARGGFRQLIQEQQRAAIDRANEAGNSRDNDRSR